MSDRLRHSYHAQKEVARSGCFEGEIELADMVRLAELLPAKVAKADPRAIRLKFEFDLNELDVPTIRGQLNTSLALQCQRCLQAMEMPVIIDFRLLIDASDEMVQESSLDTLYSDNGYIDIVALAEDEIMLELPLIALHEKESCHKYWQASESEPEEAGRENPFSVLQQLKTTD